MMNFQLQKEKSKKMKTKNKKSRVALLSQLYKKRNRKKSRLKWWLRNLHLQDKLLLDKKTQ